MAGSHDKGAQGSLPGRQTEVPNADDDFPARRDLRRADKLPESVRDRIQETDIAGTPRGLNDTGDLRGPMGNDQESRRRGSHQDG